MKNDLTLEQMKLEMAIDKDVRVFIEDIQHWYDEKTKSGELTNKSISSAAGIDASMLSRIVNGRTENPTIRTLIKIFRAMNLRVRPKVEDLSMIEAKRSNYCVSHTYDEAVAIRKMAFIVSSKENHNSLDNLNITVENRTFAPKASESRAVYTAHFSRIEGAAFNGKPQKASVIERASHGR